MSKLSKMTDFLDRLDAADMHYTLASVREGAVVVGITVPGERWEVEFFKDGDVEVEVFKSNGEIGDLSSVEELFDREPDD
jgi:hypothetical protein